MQLDALKLTKALSLRMADLAADDNFVRDKELLAQCRRLWSGPGAEGGMISPLWIEGAFPSESSEDTLDALTSAGLFQAKLRSQLDRNHDVEQGAPFPHNRFLYTHQSEAVRTAHATERNAERPALVVTAGTGAGKTESFLLPLLDDLIAHPRNDDSGIRALILYPMNALVNDQVDRLHQWLLGQSDLTLFHFTGDTPEDGDRANKAGIRPYLGKEAFRMRTRRQARGIEEPDGKKRNIETMGRGPCPDILITNYSMLEYMLSRPQDAVFFGPTLRTLVLDEAHLYTGTLAAEITLLLRRLLLRCDRQPKQILQIATSATIGSGEPGELENFAATIFSKPINSVQAIRGRRKETIWPEPEPPTHPVSPETVNACAWLTEATLQNDDNGDAFFPTDPDACSQLAASLQSLVSATRVDKALADAKKHTARLLNHALQYSPVIGQMKTILEEREAQKGMSLESLCVALWNRKDPAAVRAVISLLQIGASAREHTGDLPLLPHRLHLLARSPETISVCLNDCCNLDESQRIPGLGAVLSGHRDTCPYCKSAALSLCRCVNCGEWALGALDGITKLSPLPPFYELNDNEDEETNAPGKNAHFFTHRAGVEGERQTINPQTGAKTVSGITLTQLTECPHCARRAQKAFQSFSPQSRSALSLSIIAETALSELPPYSGNGQKWRPAGGRRILAFSDSRQEAARLGPRLTWQHETQLFRAMLTKCLLESPPADAQTLAYWEGKLSHLNDLLSKPGLLPNMKQMLTIEQNNAQRETQNQQQGGSLEEWDKAAQGRKEVEEFFDAETGENHKAAHFDDKQKPMKWNQQEWNKNAAAIRDRMKARLARELARPVRSQPMLETLGLAEITYPGIEAQLAPSEFMAVLPPAVVSTLAPYWPTLLAALCDTLRTEGAITMGSEAENFSYDLGSARIGRWCSGMKANGSRLIRFVGDFNRQPKRRSIRLRFAANVLQAAGLSEEESHKRASELLEAVFLQLCLSGGKNSASEKLAWIEYSEAQETEGGGAAEAIRLVFPALCLRRPTTLFYCKVTGHLFPRSVLGCAPEDGCSTLAPVDDQDTLDYDPRFGRRRRELQNSPIFEMGLWAEEHSAQQSPERNRRLQDLFKIGVRNILSATTTLELGIDIGGLSAVLMGNVPPGKANYLQRAGRAGRRADGSSLVLTFARPRPFDRAVFQDFQKYLERPLRSPKIFLDRERIAWRHAQSYLLGAFFRALHAPGAVVGAMRAFGDMGVFCGVPLPRWAENGRPPELEAVVDAVDTPPVAAWWNVNRNDNGLILRFQNFLQWVTAQSPGQPIRTDLMTLMRSTPVETELENWKQFLEEVQRNFEGAVEIWKKDYEELLATWEQLSKQADYRPTQLNALRYQMKTLHNITVIEAFSDQQFLPGYGFPIGLQKLRVQIPDKNDYRRVREEDQYRLERNGMQALGEYVPGSQILVGGKLVVSHGLMKHWTGANTDDAFGLRGEILECVNSHTYYRIGNHGDACPFCGGTPMGAARPMLLPRHGFTTAAWDPPRRSTDVDRVGRVEQVTVAFPRQADMQANYLTVPTFAGIEELTARYKEAGVLLVYNEGDFRNGFAICTKCGYADSERKSDGEGRINLPSNFENHSPLDDAYRKRHCWSNEVAPVLRHQRLAAKQTTDVALIDFAKCLPKEHLTENLAITLGYALQIAAGRVLELDTREIGVMTSPTGDGTVYGVVLFDNVPGGAGHVRELLERGPEWFEEAQNTLYHSPEHYALCRTACLDCLLTFDAQMQADKLESHYAHDVLRYLREGTELPPAPPNATLSLGLTFGSNLENAQAVVEVRPPSAEERIRQAQEKQAQSASNKRQRGTR